MPTFTRRVKDLYPTKTDEELGLMTYPIFDEDYRAGLNQKIKDHFWLREIGQESSSIHVFALGRKMREIMPMYNKYYKSELIEFDPLSTVNIESASTGESTSDTDNTGNTVNTATNKSGGDVVQNDFPQNALSANGNYATSASTSKSEAETSAEVEEISAVKVVAGDTNIATTKGYQGSASDLLMRYRDTILNIDLLVIAELEELYMSVWDNGDAYTY